MSAMTISAGLPVRVARPVRRTSAAAGRPAAPPVRLTRRGRLVATGLVLVLLGGGLGLSRAAADAPPAAVEVTSYTVVPGDTLWGIAAAVAGPGQDVRDVVAAVQELNNLRDSTIVAGARLLLPAP